MRISRSLMILGALIGLAGSSLLVRAREQQPDARAAQAILGLADAQKLAQRIDQLILSRATSDGVPLGERADDAEFMRRVSSRSFRTHSPHARVRDFPCRHQSEQAAALIDRLLDSPLYVHHWTNV